MPRTAKPHALSLPEARRIWLNAQRLDTAAPFGDGPEATRAAIEHLGYVQIDTINVIERCHHHILYTRIPAYRRTDLRHAQAVEKSVFEYWTHALSYVPDAGPQALPRRHAPPPQGGACLVRIGLRGRPPQGDAPSPRGRPALDPRHRRRRAGRQASPLGKPQAVEERAAVRLLHGPCRGQRADRHAQDLRPDRAPFRLGDAAEAGLGARHPRLSPRPRRFAPRASSASILSATATNKRKPAMRALDRDQGAEEGACAGRRRGRGQAGALGASGNPRRDPFTVRSARPHPLAVRPARHPARSASAFSSATTMFSRPMSRRTSAAMAISPFLCSSATGSSPPSTSRPTAAPASCSMQQWTWMDGAESRPLKRRIEEELGRFERFQLAT